MHIFATPPSPSCHASTVVEAAPGVLLAAWFGGKAEKAKDVKIYLARSDGKAWSPPEVVGVEPGQPTWNPVLFRLASGEIVLWYKAGPDPMTWTGYVRRSADVGKTWSKPAQLPAGFFGPVRAKPIQLRDGTLLAGTSVESYQSWTPYVDRSADGGVTWTRSNPFPAATGPRQIQPTLFEAADGSIVALLRSSSPRKVHRAVSMDAGKTFSAAEPLDLPNPSSGIDAVRTRAGDVFLVYNPSPLFRTPLSLARSTDAGLTWKRVRDLEGAVGEFSYPAMIESARGTLEVTYTWHRTHISHESVDPATLRG